MSFDSPQRRKLDSVSTLFPHRTQAGWRLDLTGEGTGGPRKTGTTQEGWEVRMQ